MRLPASPGNSSGRRRRGRKAVVPPLSLGEWGEAGAPGDYDPGAPTGPVELPMLPPEVSHVPADVAAAVDVAAPADLVGAADVAVPTDGGPPAAVAVAKNGVGAVTGQGAGGAEGDEGDDVAGPDGGPPVGPSGLPVDDATVVLETVLVAELDGPADAIDVTSSVPAGAISDQGVDAGPGSGRGAGEPGTVSPERESSDRAQIPDRVERMGYPVEVVPRAELVGRVSSGDGTELPHWADPPTGEVPRALSERHGEDDEMQAWRLLGSRGLHWRDDVNDWSDGPGVEELVDENDEPVTPPPAVRGGPFSFDDEFERLERERSERPSGLSDSTSPGGPGVSENSDANRTLFDAAADERAGPPATSGEDRAGLARPPTATWSGGPAWPASTELEGVPAMSPGQSPATAVGPVDGPAATVGAPSETEGTGPARGARRALPGRRRDPGPGAGSVPRPAASAPGGASAATRHTRLRPYDVGADTAVASGGPGRNVGAALATGAGLLLVFVGCYFVGARALLALAALAILGCALEAFAMLQQAGFRPATLVAALGSVGAVLAAYWRGTSALPVLFVVVLAASLVWYLVRVVEARPVVNVAVTVMGFAWVGVLGSFAGLLLQAPYGTHLFLAAVVPTVVADVAAWFAGSQFGSHQLAPHTSPGKTWEGFIAGGIAALVAGAVIGKEVTPWGGAVHGLELGLVVAIVAPIGDLVQSMIKRDLRLKDSGALLPGHGGLLDRFDSILLVLPATYFLASVLHIVR